MARGSSWPAPALSPCGEEGGEVDALIYPPWLRCGYAVADPLGRAGGQAALFPCIVYGRAAVTNCRTCGCARSSWRVRRSRRRSRGHSLAMRCQGRAMIVLYIMFYRWRLPYFTNMRLQTDENQQPHTICASTG